MPAPNSSLATLRPDLNESLEEFDLMMNADGFIASRVLPVINTRVQADTFGRIPIEELLKNADTARNNRGGYSRGSWKFEPDQYACEEHGHEQPVDDRDERMYGNYFDAELIAAGIAQHTVLMNCEKRAADLLFNTSNFTPTAVGTPWSTYATATPVEDIEAAVQRVRDASGLWPNALIVDRIVFRNLRMCDQVRDRISSNGAGSTEMASTITPRTLAQVFDLDEVIVAGGVENAANEGQTASIGSVWSTAYAMVAKVARTNSVKEPCVGRIFHWDGDGSIFTGAMETYREENVRADIVRARHDVHEKLLHAPAADLLSNIT